MKTVAVLMTCHNRREKTLACLAAVFRSQMPLDHALEVFLVDDGCTDGTAHAVRERYPQVNIAQGDGSLYWNGGMRMAFAIAMERACDYYLWLNDDTLLYSAAIGTLIATSCDLQARQGKGVIVVGSTQDASDGALTYGGVVSQSWWKPIGFDLVQPRDAPVECVSMNGNCVLIPIEIVRAVGNLEPKFAHAMGDQDYGLRARSAGFAIWIMPGFAGTCSSNAVTGSFKDASLPVAVRLRKMMQPKGLPMSSWRVFTQRHAGIFWLVFWAWPYFKVLITGLLR
jgi:GT2 family glycosyltransferase